MDGTHHSRTLFMLTRYMASLLMSNWASWLTSVVLRMLSIRLMSAAVGMAGIPDPDTETDPPAPPAPLCWLCPDMLPDPPAAAAAAAAAAAEVLAPWDCISAWRLRPLGSSWPAVPDEPAPVVPLCSCICIDCRVGVVGTESGGVDDTRAWSCGTDGRITEKELQQLVRSQL